MTTTTVTKTRFGVADRNAFGGDGTNRWRCRRVVLVLGLVALALVVLFLTYDIKGSWDYAIRLRTRKVVAMGVVGAAVAYSTVLFQTVTNNRILTPSIMGFDSLYLVIQTILVWSFGTLTLLQFDERVLFGIEVAVMVAFAGVLHRWLFGRHDRDLYVLVLIGIVLGTFFSSITALVSRMIDPNEFQTLQDRFFASFSQVDEQLLGVSVVAVVFCAIAGHGILRRLDVLVLGREMALGLGVEHRRVVNRALILVAVLVAVSTALVGPITFFGLLVANLARQLTGTFRHRYVIPTAVLLSIICLVGGQFVIERFLSFNATLSVVVNFVGGIYFIGLLLKEARR